MVDARRGPIRVPSLQFGKIVEQDGGPTDEELTFRQGLVDSMQSYMGDEGLVMPSQTTADLTIIQNHQVDQGGNLAYTCANGTLLYNSTKNDIEVSVDNGASAPVFKQVFLLDSTTIAPGAGAIIGYALTTLNGTQYKVALYALS